MSRILVVDDEIEIRQFLRQTLEEVGYDVVEAENGKMAVDYYQEHKVDVVIMDLFMPEKEGLRAIIELQSYDPEIKVIAISGGGRMGKTDMLGVTKDFGVQYAFAKPFRVLDVIRAIKSLLTVSTSSYVPTNSIYQTLR